MPPTTTRNGGVYRAGAWRLRALLLWRLASIGNIYWRPASTELRASASTGLFAMASSVHRKYLSASRVYGIKSVRVKRLFCYCVQRKPKIVDAYYKVSAMAQLRTSDAAYRVLDYQSYRHERTKQIWRISSFFSRVWRPRDFLLASRRPQYPL